ncbi:hypothetical protein RND71_005543 [Anisodus tanguticus]|uniref:Uncharacterized protein n=1 Tax=Anisodus tanguticus TaxID=243964 RepID=A0AAE1SSC4_9SOLA|nr:hypothetical protein RND71_005543 [Anisodus tanguticus]
MPEVVTLTAMMGKPKAELVTEDGPVVPGKRIEEASDYFMHAPLGSGDITQLVELRSCNWVVAITGSSTDGESGPKIKPKGVVDGQDVNIHVLPLVGPEGCRRLGLPKDGCRFKNVRCLCFFRVRKGRENSLNQCSNTRRYGAEVTHAILLGKARTTLSKSVSVPETDTGEKVEGEEGPIPGGPEPSVRYHSGRARILTLCQDLRTKGQSQVDSFYGA